MIHPTLIKYAKSYQPDEGPEKNLLRAKRAKYSLLASFESHEEIDMVNWHSMAEAINDPHISEGDFNYVMDNGWDEDSYLWEVVHQLAAEPNFLDNKLEDYL